MGDTVGELTYRGHSCIAYELPCPQLDKLITIRLNYDHSSQQYVMDVQFTEAGRSRGKGKTWRANIIPETIESKFAPSLKKEIVLQVFRAALLDMKKQFGVPPPENGELWPD